MYTQQYQKCARLFANEQASAFLSLLSNNMTFQYFLHSHFRLLRLLRTIGKSLLQRYVNEFDNNRNGWFVTGQFTICSGGLGADNLFLHIYDGMCTIMLRFDLLSRTMS